MSIYSEARELVPKFTSDPELTQARRAFKALVRSINANEEKAGLRRKRVKRGSNTSSRASTSQSEGSGT